MHMKAILFNSGMGSRLGSLTAECPKCLLKLYNGETILERQIRILSECGIHDIIITTGPFEQQLRDTLKRFTDVRVTFVPNNRYRTTNYIVSMDNAYDLLDDDVLMLHGDLVFNRRLIEKLLQSRGRSLCLYNEYQALPEKDFKGRFQDQILKEVSVSIFDKDCYALQPLYLLKKPELTAWKKKVRAFVQQGYLNVYAENALNEITDAITLHGYSYSDDYIAEIDTAEDHQRVSNAIRFFDYREQPVIHAGSYKQMLKEILRKDDIVFVVCGKSLKAEVQKQLTDYQTVFFDEVTPNPSYDIIQRGVQRFRRGTYSVIVSIGGGSTIDTAKCIKLFASMQHASDFLQNKFEYSPIKHIAIPTTAGTGSESTCFAVMYYENKKLSIEHGSALPDIALLDADFLKKLPDYQKKSTLLDALCQSMESIWSSAATEESIAYAQSCIEGIMANYRDYLHNNTEAMQKMLQASNCSGKAINITKTTAPHAMSYRLASMYHISHGHAVALCMHPILDIMYQHAQHNEALQQKMQRISICFHKTEISDAIAAFKMLFKELDLRTITVAACDVEELAASVNVQRMQNHPIVFSDEEIKEIYRSI